MRLQLLAGLLAVVSFPWAGRCDDAPDRETLEGTWLPTTAEFEGNMFPEEVRKNMKLVIKDGKFTATVGKVVDRGTIKLDASGKPKKMETTCTDGPNKGRTFLAIYERDGDTLRICYDLSGQRHPTEFKSTEGTERFLVTYKREKP